MRLAAMLWSASAASSVVKSLTLRDVLLRSRRNSGLYVNNTEGVLLIPSAQIHVTMQLVYGEMVFAFIGAAPPRIEKLDCRSVRCPVKTKSIDASLDRS